MNETCPPIDLRDIPSKVISLPGKRKRRKSCRKLFDGLGMEFQFSDGVINDRKITACILAHTHAHDTAPNKAPYAIFEDDLEFVWQVPILPSPPVDADIIYLGTNTTGCFPRKPQFYDIFGHRSVSDFALAAAYDNTYLRLYSMVSAHAILFVTQQGRDVYRAGLTEALDQQIPLDVMYSYLMPRLKVYALRQPMFREDANLQGRAKSTKERLSVTASPLPAAYPGEVRRGLKTRWDITGRVLQTKEKTLEWDMVSYLDR